MSYGIGIPILVIGKTERTDIAGLVSQGRLRVLVLPKIGRKLCQRAIARKKDFCVILGYGDGMIQINGILAESMCLDKELQTYGAG